MSLKCFFGFHKWHLHPSDKRYEGIMVHHDLCRACGSERVRWLDELSEEIIGEQIYKPPQKKTPQ